MLNQIRGKINSNASNELLLARYNAQLIQELHGQSLVSTTSHCIKQCFVTCTYFHNITSHAPIPHRIISGRFANTEKKNRYSMQSQTLPEQRLHSIHITSSQNICLTASIERTLAKPSCLFKSKSSKCISPNQHLHCQAVPILQFQMIRRSIIPHLGKNISTGSVISYCLGKEFGFLKMKMMIFVFMMSKEILALLLQDLHHVSSSSFKSEDPI